METMADRITLKTKDICDALGIGRHQLRVWVETLPPYSSRAKKERSACRYEPADLLYFAAVKCLTEKFFLPIGFISKFSEKLYLCIREPESLTTHPFIFITNYGESCSRISLTNISQEGIVFDLQPAQSLIYEFLGLSNPQVQLNLGLLKVS